MATPLFSSLALLPFFPTQAFQTGVDVYMPAADPTDGTITFVNLHRGNTDKPQVIKTRNWASSGHRMAVLFNDYLQD